MEDGLSLKVMRNVIHSPCGTTLQSGLAQPESSVVLLNDGIVLKMAN